MLFNTKDHVFWFHSTDLSILPPTPPHLDSPSIKQDKIKKQEQLQKRERQILLRLCRGQVLDSRKTENDKLLENQKETREEVTDMDKQRKLANEQQKASSASFILLCTFQERKGELLFLKVKIPTSVILQYPCINMLPLLPSSVP